MTVMNRVRESWSRKTTRRSTLSFVPIVTDLILIARGNNAKISRYELLGASYWYLNSGSSTSDTVVLKRNPIDLEKERAVAWIRKGLVVSGMAGGGLYSDADTGTDAVCFWECFEEDGVAWRFRVWEATLITARREHVAVFWCRTGVSSLCVVYYPKR